MLVDRLPVVEQDRLVVMHPLDRRGTHLDAPAPYLAEIARDSMLFRGAAGTAHLGALSLPFIYGSTTLNIVSASASPNYFDVLGMKPRASAGSFILRMGERGAAPVIVLSHVAWERYFGGDPAVIGRTLVIPYTEQRARIVGVTPSGFTYPTGAEAWIPLEPDNTVQVDIIARLAPNVTLDAARQGLFALTQRSNPFASVSPGNGKPPLHIEVSGVTAQSFAEHGPRLLAANARRTDARGGLLLLIACVNVGNLMLVRFLAREREVAVRHAMARVMATLRGLFLIESTLLAVIGGTLGCLLAVAPDSMSFDSWHRRNCRASTRSALGTCRSAPRRASSSSRRLAFGLLPSIMGSRVRSYTLLRADTRAGTEGRSKRRARRWLVAVQMALALVMLSGAALLVRTLARLQSMDLGYRPEHLSILSFTGPQSDLPNNEPNFRGGEATR